MGGDWLDREEAQIEAAFDRGEIDADGMAREIADARREWRAECQEEGHAAYDAKMDRWS